MGAVLLDLSSIEYVALALDVMSLALEYLRILSMREAPVKI